MIEILREDGIEETEMIEEDQGEETTQETVAQFQRRVIDAEEDLHEMSKDRSLGTQFLKMADAVKGNFQKNTAKQEE
jgi:hypothetical protein